MTLSYPYARKYNNCTLISNFELYVVKSTVVIRMFHIHQIWIIMNYRNFEALIFNAFLRTFLKPALSPSPNNSPLV